MTRGIRRGDWATHPDTRRVLAFAMAINPGPAKHPKVRMSALLGGLYLSDDKQVRDWFESQAISADKLIEMFPDLAPMRQADLKPRSFAADAPSVTADVDKAFSVAHERRGPGGATPWEILESAKSLTDSPDIRRFKWLLIDDEIQVILKTVSRRFAMLIAKDPDALVRMEWRQVEQLMAEVFDGLGFAVELTPPSKDGGKDVLLTCTVQGQRATYAVEIKHWREDKVGRRPLKSFVNVILREGLSGGLFLSTSGYRNNAIEQLSEVERRSVRFGSKRKVVSLCQTYVKFEEGTLLPPGNLAELLYEETI